MIKRSRMAWLSCLLVACVLAGCSQAPSTQTVQDAVQSRIRQDLGQAEQAAHALGGDGAVKIMRQLGAPEAKDVHVDNLRILDSKALDDGSYRMQLRYDTRTPNASHTTEQVYVLEKTEDGWKAIPSN